MLVQRCQAVRLLCAFCLLNRFVFDFARAETRMRAVTQFPQANNNNADDDVPPGYVIMEMIPSGENLMNNRQM